MKDNNEGDRFQLRWIIREKGCRSVGNQKLERITIHLLLLLT